MERYPNLKEEVGGSIPRCEISSTLDIKLARWSTVLCFGVGMSTSCLKKEKKREKESLDLIVN